MAHRLLVPPVRRLEGRARLPLPQRITEPIVDQLEASMMTRDAIRRARTNPNTATGPMESMQIFVVSGPGGTNTAESMSGGLPLANAPRLVDKTRGKSAGI